MTRATDLKIQNDYHCVIVVLDKEIISLSSESYNLLNRDVT